MFTKTIQNLASKIYCNRISDREIALQYIMGYAGSWYIWGGDDPSGFDCSGLSVEYCKAGGKMSRDDDATAQGLFHLFKPVGSPYRGCLVFYENTDSKIVHVEIMLNEKLSIGASGGGSRVKTVADAMKYNAFIKVRDHRSRKGICGYADPYYT